MTENNSNSLTGAASISPVEKNRTNVKTPMFVRSKDRCHIMTRTPVYNKSGSVLTYNFRYTAGEESFRPDEVQKKHVKHIIIGFYVRRHLEQFSFENAFGMTSLPLTQDITKFSKPLPANRFFLHLQEKQEATPTFQHQVNQLRREAMTIAADVYTIVYTNWYKEIYTISYAVIDMSKDIEEQFFLAKNIVKKYPNIKIICDRCDNVNKAQIAFEAGADYVCCPTFPKEVLKQNFNSLYFKNNREDYEQISAILSELLQPRPNYQLFLDFLNRNKEYNSLAIMLLDFLNVGIENDSFFIDMETSLYDLDPEILHRLICIIMMIKFELFFKKPVDKDKYIKFEPIRQVLLRAKFVDELVTSKLQTLDVTYAFTIGLCSNIELLYSYTTNNINSYIESMDARLGAIYAEQPDFSMIMNVVASMECLDLEYVDGIMASEFLTRHEILFAYENALMWLASLESFINQKKYQLMIK
ncbi:hypothetical protein [Succinivibrio sp.]|uniref:hypothetical protein n=1 Tax=Succinivibrio sp. TaxID=2053619 RepID=UPI002590A7D8|nr:hypothetical protein [Succinivibrio sp.]MDD6206850.1 hypothetical protein [Succinivibrio sp.]